jgi:hypothetical protein
MCKFGSKANRPVLPIRTYLRTEIVHEDSLQIAGTILACVMLSVLTYVAFPWIHSLSAMLEGRIFSKNAWDAVGYTASLLVIAAFCMTDIIRLRFIAVLSNVAFLTYGLGLDLEPVWLLHGILLPLNCWRLKQGLQAPTRTKLQRDR